MVGPRLFQALTQLDKNCSSIGLYLFVHRFSKNAWPPQIMWILFECRKIPSCIFRGVVFHNFIE